MTENKYQAKITKRLRTEFPDAVVMKMDSGYQQGIPDLLVLVGPQWAMLEVKADALAPQQPNQHYFVERLNEMSFAAFLFPENENDVFEQLINFFRGEAR